MQLLTLQDAKIKGCEIMNQTINKNNYYMIPRYLIALIFSEKRGGKYTANKTELKNGWTFKVNIPGLNVTLNIPFKAILKDNDKLKGIKGYNFSSATNCRSHRLGMCQVGNIKDCYAYQGEERAKNDLTNNGTLKMNSRHQIELNILFNLQVKNDPELLNRFIDYLNQKVQYLRFNVNGDFRHYSDIQLLTNICKDYTGTAYGYTAADDLDGLDQLQTVAAVNGSNKKYTNQYTCTFDLETLLKAMLEGRDCKGSCINCCKCWTFEDMEIINLFHKKDADAKLNTWNNRQFISQVLNAFNITTTPEDLQVLKGIYSSTRKHILNSGGCDLKDHDINNIKDFIYYVSNCSHYDIQDNQTLYNKDQLQELGL